MPLGPMSEALQRLRSALRLPDGEDLTDAQLVECFADRRDPAALEVLVRRHAPMVWGVCRRALGNVHDAEDAFQATFLVLVRKAAGLHSPARLGNWLYGVAQRTALKARAARARRGGRQRPLTDVPEPAVRDDLGNGLRPHLDGELSRLPEKYRTVIVLCELEGRTVREAAELLGCPDGTVASRLARGRTLLGKRLARLGLAVPGGAAPVAALAPQAAAASGPPALVNSTIHAVTRAAAGQAAGLLSPRVAALTEGVMKAMFLNKLLKGTAVLLVTLGALALGGGLLTQHRAAGPAAQQGDPARAAEKDARQPTAAAGSVQGNVTFEGKPLPAGTVSFAARGKAFTAPLQADGSYALKGVPPGNYRVVIETDSARPRPKDKGAGNAGACYVPIPRIYADLKTTPPP
jgi:RNA polymerase sigma factor (sigma-70 family)